MTRNTRGVRVFTMALTCAFTLAGGAANAAAQGQGVTVDPESPSGKEYAIPLESARRQADPRVPSRAVESTADSATLFGEGVLAPGSNGEQSRDRSGAGRPAEKGRRGTRDSDPRTAPPRSVPDVVGIAASRPAAPDGGIGMPILVLGLGLLVVLIGVVTGVVIRRRADA